MTRLTVSPAQDSLATDMSVPMGTDEETEEVPEVPMPELEPLSEVREVTHWANDPVPIAHRFLVC